MANAAVALQILTAAVTTAVSTLTPTTKMGAVLIENLDSTNSLFFTTDGTTPVAGFGNGAIQLLPLGIKTFNWDEVAAIKVIASVAGPTNCQVICRPQCGGLRGG